MAIVVKWLTQRIVAPSLVGSNPISRPIKNAKPIRAFFHTDFFSSDFFKMWLTNNDKKSRITKHGDLSEWFKVRCWKRRVANTHHEFESHSLRHSRQQFFGTVFLYLKTALSEARKSCFFILCIPWPA